jgi:hypothetical protein
MASDDGDKCMYGRVVGFSFMGGVWERTRGVQTYYSMSIRNNYQLPCRRCV